MKMTQQPLRILLLEDERSDAELIQRLLLKHDMNCVFYVAFDKNGFLKALDRFLPDVILSDNSLPQFSALDALKIASRKLKHTPFILVTGTVSEEYAADIIKQRADDYILKDRMIRLPAAIETALHQRKVEKEISDYRYALDQSAIVAITDQKGIILYANENFCKISKYAATELIGQDHRIINSGLHPDTYIKNLWATIGRGRIWQGEFCNKAKDGSLYWVDTTIIPFLNDKGKPYQYLAIRVDISERKKMQGQLIEREEQLELFIEHSPASLAMFDTEMRYIAASRRWINYYKLNRQLLVGRSHYEVFPNIPQQWKEVHQRCLTGAVEKNEEDTFTYPDGSIKWLHWEIRPWHKSTGEIGGIIIFTEDITERKKAVEDILQSQIRLNEAQAVAHVGSWEIDLVNNIHTWSDELYRIFGLDKNKTKASIKLFLSFIHPEDTAAARLFVNETLEEFNDSKIDFRFLLRDGSNRYGHIEWRFEFDAAGKPTRLFGILQDITDRKTAEENLKMLEKKILEQKIQEQKKIARAIIKAQETERNRLGQELHDNINQILAGTKMYLSVAGKKNKLTQELIKYPMELIDTSIEEIRLLCQKLATPLKNIDLKELIRKLVIDFGQSKKTKINFTYGLPDKLLPDEIKLNIYRIIQEQMNNIQKYAQAKNVTISVKSHKKSIRLMIEDDGRGFDVNLKRKGVGLSNMINRAETFNGWVEIRSEPGKGCKITVSLPIN